METQDKVTPYTTKTGIKIGGFYEKKLSSDLTFDMEIIQLAILNDQGSIRREKFRRIGTMLAVCGFLFALMLITKNRGIYGQRISSSEFRATAATRRGATACSESYGLR